MEEQLDFSVQLCRGMKHLHAKKVAHKDFKSLNVLMDGRVLKISDFNTSKEETGATMASDAARQDAEYSREIEGGGGRSGRRERLEKTRKAIT